MQKHRKKLRTNPKQMVSVGRWTKRVERMREFRAELSEPTNRREARIAAAVARKKPRKPSTTSPKEPK